VYDTLLDMGSRVNSYLIEAVLDNKCKAIYGVEINTDNVVIGNPCVYTKPTDKRNSGQHPKSGSCAFKGQQDHLQSSAGTSIA